MRGPLLAVGMTVGLTACDYKPEVYGTEVRKWTEEDKQHCGQMRVVPKKSDGTFRVRFPDGTVLGEGSTIDFQECTDTRNQVRYYLVGAGVEVINYLKLTKRDTDDSQVQEIIQRNVERVIFGL